MCSVIVGNHLLDYISFRYSENNMRKEKTYDMSTDMTAVQIACMVFFCMKCVKRTYILRGRPCLSVYFIGKTTELISLKL